MRWRQTRLSGDTAVMSRGHFLCAWKLNCLCCIWTSLPVKLSCVLQKCTKAAFAYRSTIVSQAWKQNYSASCWTLSACSVSCWWEQLKLEPLGPGQAAVGKILGKDFRQWKHYMFPHPLVYRTQIKSIFPWDWLWRVWSKLGPTRLHIFWFLSLNGKEKKTFGI